MQGGVNIEEPWQSGAAQRAWTTPNAVIVVPGIMGSELYDTVAKRTIWGLRPSLAVKALLPDGEGLAPLALLPGGEGLAPLASAPLAFAPKDQRVQAVGLLKFPSYLLGLGGGVEPYTTLVTRLRRIVKHPDAVAEFAYDWRLPVAHNARLLADRVYRHLASWRQRSGNPRAKVTLVAHSMGGLVCQALGGISEAANEVRFTITLGTPFDGAAKTAVMLSEADGRVHRMMRQVALTIPGVYDLLPAYRCVDTGDTVEPLTIADVVGLGGDEELATVAAGHRAERAGLRPPGHRALLGVEQPTPSSLVLAHGTAVGIGDTFALHPDGELTRDIHGRLLRYPGLGDGTVPRNSALPPDTEPHQVLAQQHTTLAQSDEAITFVRDIITHGRASAAPRLGDGDLGRLDLPDLVTPAGNGPAPCTTSTPTRPSARSPTPTPTPSSTIPNRTVATARCTSPPP